MALACSMVPSIRSFFLFPPFPLRLDRYGNVKVGDFGLAEDVYSTGYFRQEDKKNVKLPFKWMAPESLNDAIFTEKTDVVGILKYTVLSYQFMHTRS